MTIKTYNCAVVLPQLYVQNANTISGPMTWGFPAMSAFTGFAHALQRKLQSDGFDIYFDAVAVVCHHAEPQLAAGHSFRPRGFCLTRNPLNATGETAGIVEEGRMHLNLSLILTVSGADAPIQLDAPQASAEDASMPTQPNATLKDKIMAHALSMRLAGGSIVPPDAIQRRQRRPKFFVWHTENKDGVQRKLMRYVMPGYALISRATLLADHLMTMRETNAATTALDALLDLCALHSAPTENQSNTTEEGKIEWKTSRRKPTTGSGKGWLVPIPLGYAAISDLSPAGAAKNTRDPTVPFCFVESVLGLGSWQSPHRCTNLEDMLWRFDAQPHAGTYLISNTQAQ